MQEAQIEALVDGVHGVLGASLVGAYLHGSAVLGGLKPRSDLDVIVVAARSTSAEEKSRRAGRIVGGPAPASAGVREVRGEADREADRVGKDPRLETHDAIVLGEHPRKFRRCEPARVQPLQICVGRPTGDRAALSDENGNAVVEELLQELLRRRDADTLDLLCRLA